MSSPGRPSVCALVPHFGCEAWLGEALESVLGQSRPPDAVVVVDDGSPEPPVAIVAGHPEVTLVRTPSNGGPYRAVQAVIDGSDFDYYLFQDADDWSAPDRLEVLLAEATATGAELVGSHELRVLVDQGDVVSVRYPLDVNAALEREPAGFPLLHPTSMVARRLVARLGGFATALRFSGDAEFLRRAAHVARVVNVDHFGYFRRKRTGSLTTAPATAHHSPDRLALQAALTERAHTCAEARRQGSSVDLRPFRTVAVPELEHLEGPTLGQRLARRPRRTTSAGRRRSGQGPVFLLGAPRSGQAFLAWSLDQHPAFVALPDARWLAATVTDLERRSSDDASPPPPGFRTSLVEAVDRLAGGRGGRRWVASGSAVTDAAGALADAFPSARFVHVVRSVEEVVADLAARPTDGGAYVSPDAAWRAWWAGAGAGLAAERRLSPHRVLRVAHAELVADPGPTLERCVSFLGETYHQAAERALAALDPGPLATPPAGPARVVEACRLLSAQLLSEPATAGEAASLGGSLDVDPDGLVERRGCAGLSLVDRLRALVVDAVPPGSTVLVASKGDDRLLAVEGRTGWHFPRTDTGVYAGHHPVDSAAAVAHLEALLAMGADHLVIPAPAFWWLRHYEGLRRHLDQQAALVAFHEVVGAVYRLEGARGATEALGSPPPRLVVAS